MSNKDTTLDRITKLNSTFRLASEHLTPMQDFCNSLAYIMKSNLYLFQQDGHIFCHSTIPEFACKFNDLSLEARTLPKTFLDIFSKKDKSIFNVHEKCPLCTYSNVGVCSLGERYYSLIEIKPSEADRIGMLLIRYGIPFEENEEILCEYAGTIVTSNLMFSYQEEIRKKSIKKIYSNSAVKSLSISELFAVNTVLEMVVGNQGTIKLQDAASSSYASKSVVTNALKKLESAGVIETKTMGVKGKVINILNEFLRDDVKKSVAQQKIKHK